LTTERGARPIPETFPGDLPTADRLIDNFVQALGGASALEKIATRVETGSIEAEGRSVRVEILNEAPDKWSLVQHAVAGDNITVWNGKGAWVSAPGRPIHDLNGSELDDVRIDADLQFPLHINQMFPELRVEYPELVEGREAYVLVGIREGRAPWKFFFDAQSGLLLRLVRYAESPLGLDPTEIDYRDYREVDGVKIPFIWTIVRSGSESTVRIEKIKQNVPIEDTEFSIPSVKH
jgi:hypothetical protein